MGVAGAVRRETREHEARKKATHRARSGLLEKSEVGVTRTGYKPVESVHMQWVPYRAGAPGSPAVLSRRWSGRTRWRQRGGGCK